MHFYDDVSNLNAPYDVVPVPGGGLGADDPQYPWNAYSAKTAELQNQVNAKLKEFGGCPVVVDGVLGGSTCGAIGWLMDGDVKISTCLDHASAWTIPNFPSESGVPCAKKSTLPIQPEPGAEIEEVERKQIPAWAIGLAIGAVAIGAAFLLRKKK